MTNNLRGVLVALATPVTTESALDETALRALVDRTIEGGVHGVVACGSTGEFTALTTDERRRVVEVVVDQTAGRVPVVAQTGDTSAAKAIALTRHAQAAGVDVVMPVAPYYEALTLDETVHYLRRVADSVQIPVMVYNLPHATGVDLSPETIAGLAREVPNVRYVKNTSPDMAQAARLIHEYGDLVSTFVGWDTLILSALTSGSAGVLAGTANVIPAELVAVYDRVQEGDLDAARAAWARVYPLLDAALSTSYIAAVKTAMEAIGHSAGPVRDPLLPLSPADAARIEQQVAALRPQPART
jgi:4-hydroxy-tetrahydrodipicolinate synthase